jgi:hypothetical protein
MEAIAGQGNATMEFAIPAEHLAVALRYIDAIVLHDPVCRLSEALTASRRQELMDRFEADYRVLNFGPYARRGMDALRIALGRL